MQRLQYINAELLLRKIIKFDRKVDIYQLIKDKMINIINEIKYFIQRGSRGYSDRDLWDFDVYLNKLLINGLTQFKKSNNSKLPSQKDLDIMIKGFKSNLRMIEGNFHLGFKDKKYLILKLRFNSGMRVFQENFNSLWD